MNSNPIHNSQPCAVVGAGDLVSHLYRRNDQAERAEYSFNLFRLIQNSEVSHSLRPEDLRDVVKACQVLAFAIADDGWLPDALNTELQELVSDLDSVTQRWSGTNGK